MFREMRRRKQVLSKDEAIDILKRGKSGVLALLSNDGYPYAVPISYVYHESKLYFHGAKSGHKIDAINNCEKASFCVIEQDQIIPEEYTTYFRSVISFGKIRIMKDENEMMKAIAALAKKYHPADSYQGRDEAIDREWKSLCMIEFEIEYMTGKEAIELVRKKQV